MFRTISALSAAVAVMVPVLAYGTGWQWVGEPEFRAWDDDHAQWASDVDPEHRSAQWFKDNVNEPPRAMWCVSGVDPAITGTTSDCDILQDKIDAWLEVHLPTGLTGEEWPHECAPSSTCLLSS